MTAERRPTPAQQPPPNPVEQALANMVRDAILERRRRRATMRVVGAGDSSRSEP